MKHIALTILTIFILAGNIYGKDLKTFKEIYVNKIEKINTAHTEKLAEAVEEYGKSLEALLVKVKKTGDLDNTKAVLAEIKRFKIDPQMPETLSSLAELKKLQDSFNQLSSKNDATKAKSIVSLTDKYDKGLEKLQKKYVMNDKLEEAEAVQAERKRVKSSEAFTASKTEDKTAPDKTAPDKTSTTISGFPEGTFKYKGRNYYRLPLRHNFEEASKICEELGGHILSINSSTEYKYFSELAKKEKIAILLDLNDAKKEGEWKTWNRRTPFFTKWHSGYPKAKEDTNSACLNLQNKYEMVDVSSTKSFFVVFCEWELRSKPTMDKFPELGLCEIELQGGCSIQTLKKGAQRLSGLAAPFSTVAPDLVGAQYTKVGWQSKPTFNITITKPGYLCTYKISAWKERKDFPYVQISDALRGAFHGSGVSRVKVEKGQTFSLTGYEPGVIAAKITKK